METDHLHEENAYGICRICAQRAAAANRERARIQQSRLELISVLKVTRNRLIRLGKTTCEIDLALTSNGVKL